MTDTTGAGKVPETVRVSPDSGDVVRRYDFSCEMNADLYEALDGEYVFAADYDALANEHDILVDRSVGAMAIAEGQDGYENVPIDCPMLGAVSKLRAENLELQTRLGVCAVQLAISENKVRDLMQVSDK